MNGGRRQPKGLWKSIPEDFWKNIQERFLTEFRLWWQIKVVIRNIDWLLTTLLQSPMAAFFTPLNLTLCIHVTLGFSCSAKETHSMKLFTHCSWVTLKATLWFERMGLHVLVLGFVHLWPWKWFEHLKSLIMMDKWIFIRVKIQKSSTPKYLFSLTVWSISFSS